MVLAEYSSSLDIPSWETINIRQVAAEATKAAQ